MASLCDTVNLSLNDVGVLRDCDERVPGAPPVLLQTLPQTF